MHTVFRITIAAAVVILFTALPFTAKAQAPIITNAFQVSSLDRAVKGLFKDTGYNALSALAEGPYSSTMAVRAETPMFFTDGSNSSLTAILEKRDACNCPNGFGCCSGHCGCATENQTRCGDNCCYFGCADNGVDCKCPSAFPVACAGGQNCCPKGTTCQTDGKCSNGASGGTTNGSRIIPTTTTTTQTALPTNTTAGPNNGTGSTTPSGSSRLDWLSSWSIVVAVFLVAFSAILTA
ncbi:hypothetical protein EDD11_002536 [Mortierella claussenii]|nr:hypothetical protein EDD11_002536 [Mortierella claussenii]